MANRTDQTRVAKRDDKPATTLLFRRRLKAARTRMGWSQSALARAAGLQPSALSHYESGARRPSFTNLRRLASALQVSTDYLVGHEKASTAHADALAAQIMRLPRSDRQAVRALVESLLKRAR